MNETVKPIKKMLEARLKIREAALLAYEPSTLDNLPDAVKISREHDASILKAVIQEQKDLIEVLTLMYPNA